MERKFVAESPKHKFLQYYVREKYAVISYGIFKGFNIGNEGDWVPASRGCFYSKRNYIHIATGLQYGSLAVMKQILAGNEPYIFIEAGYLLAKPHITQLDTWNLRVVANAYQTNYISSNTDTTRLFDLCMKGLAIQERKHNPRGYILLIPPSSQSLVDLFNTPNWVNNTIDKIKKYTNRPIIIREKSSTEPLGAHLAGAHCVVAYTSNVSTDAVIAGVPAFCDEKAAAAPVCYNLDNLAMIENPIFPNEETRLDWLASLANNQFSFNEIVSGVARAVVMKEMKERGCLPSG